MLTGNNVIVYVDGLMVGGMKSCSLHVKCEKKEVCSPKSGAFQNLKPGKISWTVNSNHLISSINDNINIVGKIVTLKFGQVADGTRIIGSDSITGEALCTDCNIEATKGSIVKGSFSFAGSGKIGDISPEPEPTPGPEPEPEPGPEPGPEPADVLIYDETKVIDVSNYAEFGTVQLDNNCIVTVVGNCDNDMDFPLYELQINGAYIHSDKGLNYEALNNELNTYQISSIPTTTSTKICVENIHPVEHIVVRLRVYKRVNQ